MSDVVDDGQAPPVEAVSVPSPSVPAGSPAAPKVQTPEAPQSLEFKIKGGKYKLDATEALEWHNDRINNRDWKDKNRLRSEELNEERQAFETEREEYSNGLLQEREQHDAYIQQGFDDFNNREQQLHFDMDNFAEREKRIKEVEEGLNKRIQEFERYKNTECNLEERQLESYKGHQSLAAAEMKLEDPDFDLKFVSDYVNARFHTGWHHAPYVISMGPEECKEELQYHWNSVRGEMLPDIVAEKVREALEEIHKRKGLPRNIRGNPTPPRAPQTLEESEKAALKGLGF